MTLRDDYKKIPRQRPDDTRQAFTGNIAGTPGGEAGFSEGDDTSGSVFPDEYGTRPMEKEKPYFDVPDTEPGLRKAVPDTLKDAISQNPEAPFYTTLYKTLHPEPQDPKHQNAVKALSTLADIGLLIGEMVAASKGGDVHRRNSVLGENNKYLRDEYDRIARQKNVYRQGLLNAVMADRKENRADKAAGRAVQNRWQELPGRYPVPEDTISYDKKNRSAVAARLQNLLSEYKARGLFEDIQDLDIAGLEAEPVATQEMYIQELAKRLYEKTRNNPELKNELEAVLASLADYRGGSNIPPNGSIPYAGMSVNPLNPNDWQDYMKRAKYSGNHISDFELKTPIL